MKAVNIAAVIPARMASTRHPGKPLIEIEGLPMVEHVRRRVLLCDGFSDVIVATCDAEIQEVVETFGGKVVMTSKGHIMASDRVAEVAHVLDCSHVLNVQGDEILVVPDDLNNMIESIHVNPDGQYWNAKYCIAPEILPTLI
jgi:3-deoxy-manno-octulosonate cytidylyltransferase (CMP-KDO synthetase)